MSGMGVPGREPIPMANRPNRIPGHVLATIDIGKQVVLRWGIPTTLASGIHAPTSGANTVDLDDFPVRHEQSWAVIGGSWSIETTTTTTRLPTRRSNWVEDGGPLSGPIHGLQDT